MKRNLSSNDITETIEKEIKNIYINEFNDIFPNILKYTRGKFLSFLFKRIKLTIDSKFNDPPTQQLITKIENYINEDYYISQYKIAYDTINIIKEESLSIRKNYLFNGQNFIKHCSNIEYAYHTCGKKFYSNEAFIKNKNDIMLICIDCNKVYKNDIIKMNCEKCHDDYYTKLLLNDNDENNNKNKNLQPATWLKYHCNIVINDKIKCHHCHEIFYIDPQIPNILKCLNCKYTTDISRLRFKCILCKKNFTSEAKVYNPLEFKMIKMAVKDTLINKIKAIPNFDNNYNEIKEIEFKCNCKIDYNNCKFYHKKNCKGILLKGRMNKKDIIVCSLCRSLNFYDNYIWMCPICEQRTGINISDKNNKNRISRNNDNISKSKSKDGKNSMIYNSAEKQKYDYEIGNESSRSEFKKRKKSCDENPRMKNMRIEYSPLKILAQNYKRNCPLSSALKNRNISNKENDSGSSNHINRKNHYIKRDISPIKIIKQKLITKFDDSVSPIKRYISQPITRFEEVNLDKNDFIFNSDDYEIKCKIGEGSFGKIYKVQKNNIEYAMKKLIGTSSDDFKILKHEYDILNCVLNTKKINVINIYGMQTKILDRTTTVMYILMELAETDWEKIIIERSHQLIYYSEEELINIIKVLVYSFNELQKEKISHRDIKPQNILICKNNIFKIADFGEAKELKQNNPNTDMQTIRGTELFMSPILFQGMRLRRLNSIEHNTYKSDVFSLGFCFVFASTLTFNSLYDIREVYDMEKIELSIRKYFNKRYSDKYIKLILEMLEIDENKRMDFIELNKYILKEFP